MAQLPDQDITAIRELHDRWLKAELAGDDSQIIAVCADDIKWIPPDLPPLQGKAAIAEYLDNNRVALKEIQIANTSVYGSGSIAYLISNFCSRYVSQQSSEIQESTGTHLWILRKEAECWQVVVVAWSSWQRV